MANSAPGVPYDIPKVKASLVNVLPPDYGNPASSQAQSTPVIQSGVHSSDEGFASDTIRVNDEWKMVDGGS